MAGPVRWLRQRRARRDASAAGVLEGMRARVDSMPSGKLLFIERVYQHARRGTKAIVLDDRTRQRHDAWFWWARVRPGQMVLVHASSGFGPHTGRDDVLFVGSEYSGPAVSEVLAAELVRRARRHYERSAR